MNRLILALAATTAFAVPAWATEETVVVQVVPNAVVETETTVAAPVGPEVELLYFGYLRPGYSERCDSIREAVGEAAKVFPIEPIYFDRPSGRRQFEIWDVKDTPAFILVRNAPKGPIEIRRWYGAEGDVYGKIERAFKSARFEFPPRPGRPVAPPPRPVPFPPKPIPEPKPPRPVRPVPERPVPGRPVPGRPPKEDVRPTPPPRPIPPPRPWWKFW